jgi:ribonuclease BN (tRNA processing enzyme)
MNHAATPPADSTSRRRFLQTSAAAVGAGAVLASIPTTANASPSASKDGASRVILLGTAGGPPPEPTRAGISSALVIDGKVYLIDCGRSAVTQYIHANLLYVNIQSIFLTHLHADHVCDYYNFFLLAGFGPDNDLNDGIVSPVDVYGPGPAGALPPPFGGGTAPTINPDDPTPGLKQLTNYNINAFAYSSNILMRDSHIADVRTLIRAHEIDVPNVGANPLGPTAPPMDPFLVVDDGTVKVTAILVPHGVVYPSFAYRFDTPAGSVVFSGDTARSDNVVRLARGADILVHEVIDIAFYQNSGYPPALLNHLEVSHTDVTAVGPIAQQAGVGTLVLTHLVPATASLVSPASWKQRAQKGFDGL